MNTSKPELPWIALMGDAGAGKDTAAEVLVREYGYTRIAFADPVRQALLAVNPLISADWCVKDAVLVHGWEDAKRIFPEIRALLQRLGTDAIRSQDPNFWCRQAERAARKVDGPVVFTDTRFLNELRMVSEYHGEAILVARPSSSKLAAEAGSHISEQEWRTWPPDHILSNNGDVHQFRYLVTDLVNTKLTPNTDKGVNQ